jgi:putative endonuclease
MDSPDSYRGKFPLLFHSCKMYFVYVIQSEIDNSFYVGHTQDLAKRLEFHNDPTLNLGVTRYKMPWRYFFVLETNTKTTAIKIEKHIKQMKSRVYITNLEKYPEIGENLLKKYS